MLYLQFLKLHRRPVPGWLWRYLSWDMYVVSIWQLQYLIRQVQKLASKHSSEPRMTLSVGQDYCLALDATHRFAASVDFLLAAANPPQEDAQPVRLAHTVTHQARC
jgi:hypothetical protein